MLVLPLIGAPQIDILFFAVSPVFLHHAVDDLQVFRIDLGQLITNVKCTWIEWVDLTPPASSAKHHGWLIGNFIRQVHQESKIMIDRYWFSAVELESS